MPDLPSLSLLERGITQLAGELGLPPGRVRRYIGVVAIGQVLAREGLANVKGGSNFETRRGTLKARLSKDVDVTSALANDEFEERFAEALREGWGGFTGVLSEGRVIAIPAPEDYQPMQFKVRLSYRGQSYMTLTLELSGDEAGSGYAIENVVAADAPAWCATLGLLSPGPMPLLPLEHQIVQKLHACSTADGDGDGWKNERAHDLVDLQLAQQDYTGTASQLRALAEQLFAYRQRHPWPPTITVRDGWDALYADAAADLDVLGTVDEAVEFANAWIAEIAAAPLAA